MESKTQIIPNLVSLLTTDIEYVPMCIDLLEKLSKFCVIAGGSMIYALGKAPFDTVGDIDCFVLDQNITNEKIKEEFGVEFEIETSTSKVSNLMNFASNAQRAAKIIFSLVEKYFPEFELTSPSGNYSICVFSLKIPALRIPLQFIFSSHRDPDSVIGSFDADFVMCGYYNGQLYLKDSCKRALETKKVKVFYNKNYNGYRFRKMLAKQFSVPYFVSQMGEGKRDWVKVTQSSVLTNAVHNERFSIDYNGISGSDSNTYENPVLIGFNCDTHYANKRGSIPKKTSNLSFVCNLTQNGTTSTQVKISAISLRVKFEFAQKVANTTQYLISSETDNYELWSNFIFYSMDGYVKNLSMESWNIVVVTPIYYDNQFYLLIYSVEDFEPLPVNLSLCKKSLTKVVAEN
jgi:hypothetical protein